MDTVTACSVYVQARRLHHVRMRMAREGGPGFSRTTMSFGEKLGEWGPGLLCSVLRGGSKVRVPLARIPYDADQPH